MRFFDFVQTFTCVKSLVTLSLTGAFVYLSIAGVITPENFMTIYTMIIGFYFGTQWQKKQTGKDNNDT